MASKLLLQEGFLKYHLFMNKPLRILHLEDEPDYSRLVRSLLDKEGLPAEIVLVTSRADYEAQVAAGQYDLILSDYVLPDYNGLQALALARRECPAVPFLVVSGTIGEQAAIDSLKAGATDYVLKQWPERLVPAIRRAVQEVCDRQKRQHAERELLRREQYFGALTENALDVFTVLDAQGRFLYNSPSLRNVLGYEPKELIGRNAFELVHPEDRPLTEGALQQVLAEPGKTARLEFRYRHRDGSWRWLEVIGRNRLEDPEVAGVIVNSRDISDRRAIEADLRENEQQYRLIFDGNPTPMWIFDHETLAFLVVNDAAIEVYGYSREEFLRMTLADLRPPGEAPAMAEYLHQLVADKIPTRPGFAGVWRHRTRKGSLIDVELKWAPVGFKERMASLMMVNDITERKRIEHRDAALSQLGHNLSAASSPAEAARTIKAVADELFRWDAFTLDLYSSELDRVLPVLNVDTDRSGRRFEVPLTGATKFPSKMARRVIEQGAELILRQEPVQMPPDVVPIGDTTRPSASLALVPIRNRTRVIGILSLQSYSLNAYNEADLGTLQTLADHCGGALERMRAEQALRSSEMLFHSVWENSVDGMRLTDEAGTMVAVNAAFCRLVGSVRADLEGKAFTVIYARSEEPEQLMAGYRRSFQEQALESKHERQVTLHDGKVLTLEETRSPVDLRGQSRLVLSLFRDVTAQRQLEDQFRQAQKMEAIGQLAGGVAHDFNNILTVIHGHAALLNHGGHLADVPARSAQQIVQAAERAAALTRQLLTFSRRQVIQPRPLDLNEVVTNVTKMLARILGEDIALQLHYWPVPAMIQADPGMLEQVLLNLAVNSRDAMPKGGLLTIKISVLELEGGEASPESEARAGRFACLTVTDTGCGIEPANLPRIFDPFFTTKEVGKGTGLGLATVYGIVKQHHGWITVQSEVRKGTSFKVLLPCSAEPVKQPEPEATPKSVPGGTETILVVEDEAPVRELVCQLLAGYGYRILQARSGPHALELWASCKSKIDLLLTDLVMPDRMNGRELAERLRAERPELKVIFTSGYSAEVVGKDFILRDGLNYLQKPYDAHRLARAVRECLDAVN